MTLDEWIARLDDLNHRRALAVYAHLPEEILPHGSPESNQALAQAQAQPDVLALSNEIANHVAAYPGEI